MDYQELSNNIQRLRKAKGLTQDNLAEKLGVSSQAVSKWENGISFPDISLLPKLADLFEVSMDDLFSHYTPDIVTLVPEATRKSVDDLFFRVRVLSSDGDKVNINLPLALLKIIKTSDGTSLNIGGTNVLDGIDLNALIDLAERGVMGKLMEVDSADGDHVEIFVE